MRRRKCRLMAPVTVPVPVKTAAKITWSQMAAVLVNVNVKIVKPLP